MFKMQISTQTDQSNLRKNIASNKKYTGPVLDLYWVRLSHPI